MKQQILLYNTLTKRKEPFHPSRTGSTEGLYPKVGMYVCGPTVYGDPHLGHARSAITFDILYRILRHQGIVVTYVRNITDVGHLTDSGEDKIELKAKGIGLDPLTIARYYTNKYHMCMDRLGCYPPTIEPKASEHIQEQIEVIQEILNNGYAYVKDGSVYFDTIKYASNHKYGKLSGRVIEDSLEITRDLQGTSDKKNQADFALWKKSKPGDLQKWLSPWSEGCPGWHIECTAMSRKYLGKTYNIHGGGLDLIFPHHECEIAQSIASTGREPCSFWVHNNMITIDGKKMGKSLGNFITLEQFFTGNHPILSKAYSPMTIRFFILQAHYRSPLDFSDQALQAAERGLKTLMEMIQETNEKIVLEQPDSVMDKITKVNEDCMSFLYDDMATPQVLSSLFSLREIITGPLNKREKIELQSLFSTIVGDLLGLSQEILVETKPFEEAVNYIIGLRKEARDNKDWETSDKIRDFLENSGFEIKDTNSSTKWKLK